MDYRVILSASDDFWSIKFSTNCFCKSERGHKTLHGHINEKDLNSKLAD